MVLRPILLLLFILILAGYVLRATIWRRTMREVFGSYDAPGEALHFTCAVLMLPMLVGVWMMNPNLRATSVWLAIICAALFLVRWFARKQSSWLDPLHATMFLGMGFMYFTFTRFIGNYFTTAILLKAFAAFYLLFSVYYAKKFLEMFGQADRRRRWLCLQSEFAHVVIGIAMVGMLLWPMVFMAM